jgi:CheY-like chemotaxis protein
MHVRFEVADSGIGISPEAQTRLFEPFTQADSSVTRKFGGTGLGLAICRRLVELMGGEIGIDSQPHQGSTFWFTVRLASGASHSALSTRGLDKQHILVVIDHPTNRDILREHFASWRISVDEVLDGPAALRTLREAAGAGRPYDLLLVGSGGLELAQAIKADLSIASTHMVLLTSRAQMPQQERAERAGIAACVALPVRQSHLFDTLAEVVFSDVGVAAPVRGTPLVPQVARAVGRLLVVEDSRINQRVAVGLLQRLGYRADAVANGVEALEALGRGTYEAVFMDCQMPEMDGYEATREWRRREQDGSGGHTRIIAMTANAMQGDREACLLAGMDDYVSKPVRKQELSESLDRWLATKPSG